MIRIIFTFSHLNEHNMHSISIMKSDDHKNWWLSFDCRKYFCIHQLIVTSHINQLLAQRLSIQHLQPLLGFFFDCLQAGVCK